MLPQSAPGPNWPVLASTQHNFTRAPARRVCNARERMSPRPSQRACPPIDTLRAWWLTSPYLVFRTAPPQKCAPTIILRIPPGQQRLHYRLLPPHQVGAWRQEPVVIYKQHTGDIVYWPPIIYNPNVTRYFQNVGVFGTYYDLCDTIDFTARLEYFSDGILDELLRLEKLITQTMATPDCRLASYHQKTWTLLTGMALSLTTMTRLQ